MGTPSILMDESGTWYPEVARGRVEGHQIAAGQGADALLDTVNHLSEHLPDTDDATAYVVGMAAAHTEIVRERIML